MDILDALSKERKALEKLSKFHFILGVVSDTADRKKGDITNADLLYVHEYGSPIRKIPPRPILAETIKRTEAIVDKGINLAVNVIVDKGGSVEEAKRQLEIAAMRVESYARKMIRSGSGGFKPLKSATIQRKGSNLPLMDTGQLSRSIVCLVVDESISQK